MALAASGTICPQKAHVLSFSSQRTPPGSWEYTERDIILIPISLENTPIGRWIAAFFIGRKLSFDKIVGAARPASSLTHGRKLNPIGSDF